MHGNYSDKNICSIKCLLSVSQPWIQVCIASSDQWNYSILYDYEYQIEILFWDNFWLLKIEELILKSTKFSHSFVLIINSVFLFFFLFSEELTTKQAL